MHFSNEIAQIKGIGLNGAIAIQIIHYWISQYKQQEREQNFRDGRYWHYSTYDELHEKYFPFISEVKTVKSVFLRLEHFGVLLSGAYGAGRKKWYTIDYDELDRLIAAHAKKAKESTAGQLSPAFSGDMGSTHEANRKHPASKHEA